MGGAREWQGGSCPCALLPAPTAAPTCQNNDLGALQWFSIFCKKQLNALQFLV